MVERVARGRISVPAAAAIGAVSAGLFVAGSAFAAGRDATLQIRVQVVDSCEVRLNQGGGLDQHCGSGESLPPMITTSIVAEPMITTSDVVEPLSGDESEQPGAMDAKGSSAASASAAAAGLDAPGRAVAASQRAKGVAAQIVERVRYITLTY
jgi:hypothetical protein